MSTDTSETSDVSVTHLVTGIIADAQELGVKHLELIRSEVLQEIRKTTEAIVTLAVGFALILIGGVVFCHMAAYLLSQQLPALTLWQCYGIVGVAVALIGAIPILSGLSKLRALQPTTSGLTGGLTRTSPEGA
jgi:hypothetical protein